MGTLPSSIEAYLQEAGFSGTELLILKNLLAEDALSLRELAAKTGKSTGVLDQAAKKLMRKNIIARENINDGPKFVLKSMNAVVDWMQEDMQLKQQMMVRRHEDFETFVRTLIAGKKRPEMEYFEGKEGVKKAYTMLLDRGNDIVQYGPTLYLAEEDPLRDFRVQHFRDRRGRGIFSRVITHNTVLGRRFQSRDAFEYRKTVLVEQGTYPFQFEKMIVGDTVACFQLREDRACFINYPELAHEERVFFERLWNKKVSHQPVSPEDIQKAAVYDAAAPRKTTVPFATRTFSQLRDFFLSRNSLIAFGVCAVLAAGVTFGMYKYNSAIALQRIQEKVRSIAATGALQFEAEDLEKMRILQDVNKPEYAKLVYQLNQIRNQNEGVKFVYLMRPKNGSIWEFIADADSANPYIDIDFDGDGQLTDIDEQTYPGVQYDTDKNRFLSLESLKKPTVLHPDRDQWGTVIAGWAPIFDENQKAVGILGIDIETEMLSEFSYSTTALFLLFAGCFLFFTLIRLAAFNRSLLQEILELCHAKKVVLSFIGGLIATLSLSITLYILDTNANIQREREKILAIATTGAVQFSAEELNQLQVLRDMQKPEHQNVVKKLHDIQEQNAKIQYAYIIRPRKGTTTFEFIADADTYLFDIFQGNDFDKDGVIDASDEMGYPGLSYDVSHIDALQREDYHQPIVTEKPYTDKWGTSLSGYAPIKNAAGVTVALLAIDVDARGIYAVHLKTLLPLFAFLSAFAVFLLFRSPGFSKTLMSQLLRVIFSRKVLTIAAFILMGAYWLTFGLYFYTLSLMKEEIGKRLMSIAVTAASQIDPKDLESLRFAKDMKSEQYQKVFNQLNDIRDKNPDITFMYIMRPTYQEGVWEFVVDADSNYFIPFKGIDYNFDEIVDEADENVAPGVAYDLQYCCANTSAFGLKMPVFEMGYEDQWGASMSASAPIIDADRTVAILMIDIYLEKVLEERNMKFLKIVLIYEAIITGLISTFILIYKRKIKL